METTKHKNNPSAYIKDVISKIENLNIMLSIHALYI